MRTSGSLASFTARMKPAAAAVRISNLVSLSNTLIEPISRLVMCPRRQMSGMSQRGSALRLRPALMRNQSIGSRGPRSRGPRSSLLASKRGSRASRGPRVSRCCGASSRSSGAGSWLRKKRARAVAISCGVRRSIRALARAVSSSVGASANEEWSSRRARSCARIASGEGGSIHSGVIRAAWNSRSARRRLV